MTSPKHADPRAVKRQVQQWDNNVLECRTYGHHWQPSRATFNRDHRLYYIVQLCPRCLSERHMEMSERGAVYGSWIRYADGYLTEGLGRITGESRDTLRLAAVERTFPLQRLTAKQAKQDRIHTKAAREDLGLEWEDAS